MLEQYLVETEHRLGQGHVAELYRDAQGHRLVAVASAGERRARLNLARPAAWAAGKLHAAGTLIWQRFVSPCGQLTLRPANPDC